MIVHSISLKGTNRRGHLINCKRDFRNLKNLSNSQAVFFMTRKKLQNSNFQTNCEECILAKEDL